MADILHKLCRDIKDIRVYLIKIGKGRRQGNILTKKLSEANEIFSTFQSCIDRISTDVKAGHIKSSDSKVIDKYICEFRTLYTEVIQLCQFSDSDENTMSAFDLKVALSLLPLMTDEEANTKQLIDNIDYYASTLTSSDCKLLIDFVLKSRLSQGAKLQLKSSYSSVSELTSDMKNVLLPKKSATAIQEKLTHMRQNDLSVRDFGKQISELFIDLTISQANGSSSSYDVLKPLNEKFAIKKFSDGLRNRRLSTIIAARDFSSLKDAIQAAQDEEVQSSTSGEILGMSSNRGMRNNSCFRGRGRSLAQNYGRHQRSSSYVGARRNGFAGYRGGFNHRGSYRGRGQQQPYTSPARRANRGTSYYNSRLNRGLRHNINVATQSESQLNSESESTFFRE